MLSLNLFRSRHFNQLTFIQYLWWTYLILTVKVDILSFVNLLIWLDSLYPCQRVTRFLPFINILFIHTCNLSYISTPLYHNPRWPLQPIPQTQSKCRTLYQRWQRTWGNKTRNQGFQEESRREREGEEKNPSFSWDRLPFNPTFGTMGDTEWHKRQMKIKLMNDWMNE